MSHIHSTHIQIDQKRKKYKVTHTNIKDTKIKTKKQDNCKSRKIWHPDNLSVVTLGARQQTRQYGIGGNFALEEFATGLFGSEH